MIDIPHKPRLFDLFYGGKGADKEKWERQLTLQENVARP